MAGRAADDVADEGTVPGVPDVDPLRAIEDAVVAEPRVAPAAASQSPDGPGLESRLRKLEENTGVEFIRREARLIPALVNLWRYFRPLSGDDLRSQAALTAFLWRVLSPGTAAAAGGLLMIWLTAAQVVLVAQQNRKLDQQTYLAEASRRGALTAEFATLSERVGAERAQSASTNRGIAWRRFKVEVTHFRLEETTLARLSAFTRSAKAYHYLDLDSGDPGAGDRGVLPRVLDWLGTQGGVSGPLPRLNPVPLSPERGQALSFLATTAVDLGEGASWGLDFSRADLRSVQIVALKGRTLNLSRADLTDAVLLAVDLASADLRGATLRNACWQEGDISLAKLDGADLRGAYLNDIALPTTDRVEGIRMDASTNLDGSFSFFPGWIEAVSSGQPSLAPFLARYRVVEKARDFIEHDFEGNAGKPVTRKIFVLEASREGRPARPPSCALLPGA